MMDDKQHSSPVAHAESFRILCTIAASTDMELDSVDVNQAFLFADIKDDVYIKQPDGNFRQRKFC
jgi:hypothetical protein